MTKRFLSRLIAAALLVSILMTAVACNPSGSGEQSTAPETTPVTPETTKAPETTEAPETTKAPETTEAPETTKAPETTQPPETTKEPETTQPPEIPSAPPVDPVFDPTLNTPPSNNAVAIKTAEEFLAMKADGEYYLANDITLTATWNGGTELKYTSEDIPFTGSFNGMGFTVTTNVAMFGNVAGTVFNFTVEGEIAGIVNPADTNGKMYNNAAVAVSVLGNATFANIYNKANITGADAGAIVGYGAASSNILISNCANDGNIISTSGGRVGGIAGCIDGDTVTIKNCINNGNTHTNNYGGGILGRFGSGMDTEKGQIAYITDCINTGYILADQSQVGSMLGYLDGGAEIIGCVNHGRIENKKGIAGGIFGSSAKTKNTISLLIKSCLNYGEVIGTVNIGGIAGSSGNSVQHTKGYVIDSCINFGSIYGKNPGGDIAVGGIAGYAYGGAEGNKIINCINAGNIIVENTDKSANIGAVLGYVNSDFFVMENIINIGMVSYSSTANREANVLSLIGYNKSVKGPTGNCNSVACGDLPLALYGKSPIINPSAGVIYTEEEVKNGTVVLALNALAGTELFYLEGDIIRHK